MATINIQGQSVTVDDSFLKLSPDQQNATVDEIASHLGVKPTATAQASQAPQAAQVDPRLAQLQQFGFTDDLGTKLPFGSKVMAAGRATGDAIANAIQGKSLAFGQSYDNALSNIDQQAAAYEAQNPGMSKLSRLGSFAVMPPAGKLADVVGEAAPAISAIAPTFGQIVGNGAKAGAILGGAQGAGDARGDLQSALYGGAAGAAMGGAVGAAIPAILSGIPTAYNAAKNIFYPVKQALGDTTGMAEQTAGKILNEAAGSSIPMPETPLPGMRVPTGQATNNPGLMALQQGLPATPQYAAALSDAQAANNGAIHGAIGQLGDLNAAHEAPSVLANSLETARDAARASVQSAWKAAGIDEATTQIPTHPLKQALSDYVGSLEPIERSALPADAINAISDLGDTTTLKSVQAIRSVLGGQQAQAARAGDANTARIIGGAANSLESFIEDPIASNIPQQALDAYNAARAATKDFHQTFSMPAPVRNVLGVDRFGADKVPLSATADQFIKTGKGASEALQSYLTAIRGAAPEVQDQAKDALRSSFAQKFLDVATSYGKDASGNNNVTQAGVQKAIDQYGHVINSGLYTPEQRAIFTKIGDAVDMISRKSAGVTGSNTFEKLSSNSWLNAILDKRAAAAVNMVSKAGPSVGAGAGAFAFGPIGAAGGSAVGDMAKGAVLGKFDAVRETAFDLLREASLDPALAKALMMKATDGSLKVVSPAVRQSILGLLAGPQAARAVGGLAGQALSSEGGQ